MTPKKNPIFLCRLSKPVEPEELVGEPEEPAEPGDSNKPAEPEDPNKPVEPQSDELFDDTVVCWCC